MRAAAAVSAADSRTKRRNADRLGFDRVVVTLVPSPRVRKAPKAGAVRCEIESRSQPFKTPMRHRDVAAESDDDRGHSRHEEHESVELNHDTTSASSTGSSSLTVC